MALTPLERITKQKILLQESHPFFAYLIMRLRLHEGDPKGNARMKTMCVDALGNLTFWQAFVDTLSDDELQGVLAHEVLHVALLHVARWPRDADHSEWNVSIDVVVNAMLILEGFKLPKGGLIVADDTLVIKDAKGKSHSFPEVHKACAEEVYYFIRKHLPKNSGAQGWDDHQFGQPGAEGASDNNPYPQEDIDRMQRDWQQRMCEAAEAARNRGRGAGTMDGLLKDQLQPKIDWRTRLMRFITSAVPVGQTWARPGRKAFATGIYLPKVTKEGIDVVIHVDTSRSTMPDREAFYSEMRGLVMSHDALQATLILADDGIQAVYELNPRNYPEFSGNPVKEGNGGTSHIPVMKWIDEHKPDTKVFVTFTDGESDLDQALPMLPAMCRAMVLLPGSADVDNGSKWHRHAEVLRIE